MDKNELKARYEGVGVEQLRAKLFSAERMLQKFDDLRTKFKGEYDKAAEEYNALPSGEDEQAARDKTNTSAGVKHEDGTLWKTGDTGKAKKTASSRKASWSVRLAIATGSWQEGQRRQSSTRGKVASDIHADLLATIAELERLGGIPESALTMENMKFLWKEGPGKRTSLRAAYKDRTGRNWSPDATDHAHEDEKPADAEQADSDGEVAAAMDTEDEQTV